mmetsp:Transcript_25458/g.73480  ORF Transcript_25458/g.73480 Transcript_25458/m.73480 type:complete len:215 (-) Transcript_25458:1022-1666(-)
MCRPPRPAASRPAGSVSCARQGRRPCPRPRGSSGARCRAAAGRRRGSEAASRERGVAAEPSQRSSRGVRASSCRRAPAPRESGQQSGRRRWRPRCRTRAGLRRLCSSGRPPRCPSPSSPGCPRAGLSRACSPHRAEWRQRPERQPRTAASAAHLCSPRRQLQMATAPCPLPLPSGSRPGTCQRCSTHESRGRTQGMLQGSPVMKRCSMPGSSPV